MSTLMTNYSEANAARKHSTIQGELVTAINAVVKPTRIARAFPELGMLLADGQ